MKTRICKEDKKILRAYVTRHGNGIYPVKEQVEMQAAYDALLPRIIALLANIYPAKDMEILEKYKMIMDNPYVQLVYPAKDKGYTKTVAVKMPSESPGTGEYRYITLPDVPLIKLPNTSWRGIRIAVLEENTQFLADVHRMVTATEEFNAAKEELFHAYLSLVTNTAYMEDLIVAWPEAEAILQKERETGTDITGAMSLVQQNLCERGVKVC